MRRLKSISMSITVFIFSIIAVVDCASGRSTDRPKYFEVFSTHQHWEGTYIYNSSLYYCYLYINSEHYLKKDGLLATLRDRDGVTVELEGESPGQNDLEVKFSVHVMFHHADRFPINFTLQGLLSQDPSDTWLFKAVMTPKDPKGLFGRFVLHESVSSLGPPSVKEDSKAWKYVLIIVLPIMLAVVGVTAAITLIYWAVKKGYIRHVPKSYDSFHNPVRFDNNEVGEGRNVHI